MKTLNNFEESLEYVNRLGIVARSKPIGWKQNDLVCIVKELEKIATIPFTPGIYPFKVRYLRKWYEKTGKYYFMVEKAYYSIIEEVRYQ